MRIGISEWSLHQNFGRMVNNPRPMTVMQYLHLAGEWKVDALQVESIPGDPGELGAIRAAAERLGLQLEVEAATVDPELLGPKLHAAKTLGASVVRTFPALNRCRKNPPLAQQIDSAVHNLKQLADLAERLGIFIAVENHGNMVGEWSVADQDISATELAGLIDRVNSPFIGVCLDTGNCLFFLQDPVETARLLGPRTFTVHLKDYRIRRAMSGAEVAGCTLGEGSVDLPAIVQLLRRLSPMKDRLALQVEAPVENVWVPFLAPGFWDDYPAGEVGRIPDFVKFIAERGESPDADFRSPASGGWLLDDILEHEREQSLRSIAYARDVLERLQ